MAEAEVRQRFLNPCVLHLQKMELELKCLACLNLLNNPVMLPCNHIFCSLCIKNLMSYELSCAACKMPFIHQDLRPAPHMESMVSIYRSMSVVFGAKCANSISHADVFDIKQSSNENPNSHTSDVNKIQEEELQNTSREKLTNFQPINAVTFIDGGETCSPPSFCGAKDSDDDSNDQGSALKLPGKGCKRELGNDKFTFDINQRTSSKTNEFLDRELKRHKSDNEISNNGLDSKGRNDASVSLYSNCESKSEQHEVHTNLQEHCSDAMPTVTCVFCLSSQESEASGPMLHYDNGTPIMTAHSVQSNDILHVHQKCVEWAPQVYFVGDNAKNLDAEISRAAKIKCSKCGQKGAALGCYAKSCRKSFHVPCAVEILGCRWDSEDFLLLCPTHSSYKFPSDKSKNGKRVKKASASEIQIEQLQSSRGPSMIQEMGAACADEFNKAKEWVLCGSALSSMDNILLGKFASVTGATLSRDWKPNVTHVIASTDESGACSRTLKFLMGILGGKWILKIDWIKECMKSHKPVAEECYEINHDIHGCFDGPRNGRIRIKDKGVPLFSGLAFYFSGQFVTSYKGYLEDLIIVAGGTILRESDIPNCDREGKLLKRFIVYNLDPPPESSSTDRADIIKKRVEDANSLASKSASSQVVNHTWLLDSIAACKLQHWPC